MELGNHYDPDLELLNFASLTRDCPIPVFSRMEVLQ
jgi:hypothetical protein